MAKIKIPGSKASLSYEADLYCRAIKLCKDVFEQRRKRLKYYFPLCRFRYSKRFHQAKLYHYKPAVMQLRQIMVTCDVAANEIVRLLDEQLAKSDHDRAIVPYLVEANKNMHALNKTAIDCANNLAPYETPKLGRIEENSEEQHRFVITGQISYPNAPISPKGWLTRTKQIALRAR